MKTSFTEAIPAMTRAPRGMALFQMVLYLGIAGVLIAGAIVLYQSVSQSNARTELLNDVRQLRGAVSRSWTGQGTYAGLSMSAVDSMGGVPASMKDGSKFVTPLAWSPGNAVTGHSVAVMQLTGGTFKKKAFSIAVANLSQAACQTLLGGFTGQTRNRNGMRGYAVQASFSSIVPDSIFNTTLPLTVARATSACNKADGKNNVYLAFD